VYSIFLILMLLTCIIIVFATNGVVRDTSESSLISQIDTATQKIISGSAKLFSENLHVGETGYSRIYSYAMGDSYRLDYSMGPSPSFFQYGDTYLAPPLQLTDPVRQYKPVSLSHSAYYVQYSTPANISNYNINQTRDQAAQLDTYFVPLYQLYTDFVGAYMGFQNGMFQRYPGAGTLDSDPGRTYNPTLRGWYKSSMANQGGAIYTSPYQDFDTKNWMVTVAVPIFNVVDNSFVGVAGGDMLLTTITNNIQRINFLDTGKVTLFELEGTIVADKEWDTSNINNNIPWTYQNLKNPPVSDDLFNQIKSVPTGETQVISADINGDTYSLTVIHLSGYGDKYFLVVFILESEILKPVSQILQEMDAVNIGITVGLIIGLIATSVLIIVIVICTANSIIKPIDQINKNIQRMIQNIGTEDITDGVTGITGGVGEEQQALKINFNLMIQHVKEYRQNAANEHVENPYFNGEHEYVADIEGFNRYPEGAVFMNNEIKDETKDESIEKNESSEKSNEENSSGG